MKSSNPIFRHCLVPLFIAMVIVFHPKTITPSQAQQASTNHSAHAATSDADQDSLAKQIHELQDKVARLRFPKPSPCGRTPLRATGLSRSYGSAEVFTDVALTIDRGSRVVVLGLNGAGKARIVSGVGDCFWVVRGR